MGRIALLFPGQGSQAVGMGKALADKYPAARAVFDQADAALGWPLSKLCFEGPDTELKRTAVTQPAILTTSIAVWKVATAELGLTADAVCGHSLGEYSALVAAGCLTLRDAVKAVNARGQFMQTAVPEGVGAMGAVLGLDAAAIREVCAKVSNPAAGELVEVANYNGPDQTVISGHKAGVEKATAALKEAGAKRVLPLPVSAPFHCGLMKPVQAQLQHVLDGCTFAPLAVPCVANVNAEPNQDPMKHRGLLIDQVVASVRFTQSVEALLGMGVDTFVELGPGKVLTGIVKRIRKDVKLINIEDPAGLDAARAALAG
ncbi:MAG: ACP S-malonyltransferase [Deltaproteobacteria bacterium]|nr:ACP S-malonyltransferase [Deltaproteobacteria bacterium]